MSVAPRDAVPGPPRRDDVRIESHTSNAPRPSFEMLTGRPRAFFLNPTKTQRAERMGSLHLNGALKLANDADYCAALDELADALLVDPDSPAAARIAALVEAIERYEATHVHVPDWPVPPVTVSAGRARTAREGSPPLSRD
jgi:hypothetical protein